MTNLVKKCIGLDVSKAQINCAKEKNATEGNDAVVFMVADAQSESMQETYPKSILSTTGVDTSPI